VCHLRIGLGTFGIMCRPTQTVPLLLLLAHGLRQIFRHLLQVLLLAPLLLGEGLGFLDKLLLKLIGLDRIAVAHELVRSLLVTGIPAQSIQGFVIGRTSQHHVGGKSHGVEYS